MSPQQSRLQSSHDAINCYRCKRKHKQKCFPQLFLFLAIIGSQIIALDAFQTLSSSFKDASPKSYLQIHPRPFLSRSPFGQLISLPVYQRKKYLNAKATNVIDGVENKVEREKDLTKAISLLQSELNFKKRSNAALLFQSEPKLYNIYIDYIHVIESLNDKSPKERLQIQKRIQTPVQFLRTHVGMGREKLRNISIKHPDLLAPILIQLSQNTDNPHLKSTIDILKQDLDVNDKQIKAIKKTAPNVLRRIYRLDLRRKLHFLNNLLHFDQKEKNDTSTSKSKLKSRKKLKSKQSSKQLQKVILKRPQLLAYSTDNLGSTVRFFTDELGLSKKQLAKMVSSMPLVLTYSVDNNLRPTIELLYEFVGCTEEQVTRIVYRYPQVLSQSVKTLAPKVEHLREAFHLKEWDDLPRIVTLFPPLLWLSEANLNNKILFLTKELDLSNEELRNIIVTMPALLGLSVECNLRPKINFFLQSEDTEEEASSMAMLETLSSCVGEDDSDDREEDGWKRGGGGGLTRRELKDFVIYQPALLAYSLENRIIPRVKRMSVVNISLSFSPPYVLSITDEKFDQWLNMQSSSWTVLSMQEE